MAVINKNQGLRAVSNRLRNSIPDHGSLSPFEPQHATPLPRDGWADGRTEQQPVELPARTLKLVTHLCMR